MRYRVIAIAAILLLAVPLLWIVGSADHEERHITLSPDGVQYTVECQTAFIEAFYQVSPGIWQVACEALPATATPAPTATNTPEATATNTPGSGHDTTIWHGPAGNTHEHGAAPPGWLPTGGPCAGLAFEQMAAGREHHNFYNAYEGVTSNGVRIYIVNHIAPTIAGRSHGDHDESILVRDRSGNVSCWQGIGGYAPQDAPETDPIEVFVKDCGGGGPQGPIILVDCGLASESWYQTPGKNWCDNTTHVNGVWQDINGVNRGDGGSRHVELSCYQPRLPGPGAIHVASTLAQDCIVPSYGGPCAFKATSAFAHDYSNGLQMSGPN